MQIPRSALESVLTGVAGSPGVCTDAPGLPAPGNRAVLSLTPDPLPLAQVQGIQTGCAALPLSLEACGE